MKRILLSVTVLFVVCFSYSQNVNIPDANFKNALISGGVDKNGDSEISYAEAEAIKKLDLNEKNISDMTGILFNRDFLLGITCCKKSYLLVVVFALIRIFHYRNPKGYREVPSQYFLFA
jgi:hypothetical protein